MKNLKFFLIFIFSYTIFSYTIFSSDSDSDKVASTSSRAASSSSIIPDHVAACSSNISIKERQKLETIRYALIRQINKVNENVNIVDRRVIKWFGPNPRRLARRKPDPSGYFLNGVINFHIFPLMATEFIKDFIHRYTLSYGRGKENTIFSTPGIIKSYHYQTRPNGRIFENGEPQFNAVLFEISYVDNKINHRVATTLPVYKSLEFEQLELELSKNEEFWKGIMSVDKVPNDLGISLPDNSYIAAIKRPNPDSKLDLLKKYGLVLIKSDPSSIAQGSTRSDIILLLNPAADIFR